MTRDEVLERLKAQRAEFDARVHAIPGDSLDEPVPGSLHSPKQIVAHVNAYERLIVDRLRAARLGEKTAFDRDRVGWEAFNDRIWAESAEQPAEVVLSRSARDFLELLEEVAILGNAELSETRGVTAAIDPAWLQGRSLSEVIGVDGFEHYSAHFAQLEAAARA
ncbi:MAG: ClbS/DfsB family four-helix bundle protein [Coriobacteriia bacterium]|nr:ClbS/DfsB family four-helix bundle protein [Coriobacteriia bacterium]